MANSTCRTINMYTEEGYKAATDEQRASWCAGLARYWAHKAATRKVAAENAAEAAEAAEERKALARAHYLAYSTVVL